MPTTVTNTIRSSGGDYSSLSAWESAEQADIVTADELHVAELYDDWASGLDDTITIDGWTTDSTRFIRVIPASGHEHNGTRESGFFFKTNTNNEILQVDQDYTELILLDAEHTNTLASSECYELPGIVTVDRCLGKTASRPVFTGSPANGSVIKNCLALDNGFSIGSVGDYGVAVINCTAIGNGSGAGFNNPTAAREHIVRNCVAFNYATDFDSDFQDGTSASNCASEDTTATSTNSVTGITSSDFVNYAGGDYTPASGGNLHDAGYDASSYTTIDITGASRDSTFDIGAFEFISVGADSPSESIRHRLYQRLILH